MQFSSAFAITVVAVLFLVLQINGTSKPLNLNKMRAKVREM